LELEQGRSALLHNEPDAGAHLAYAYRRNHVGSTAFMLARALQPRLAEQARLASSYERMWSAAFSPDGKQLVTTDDRNAQLWDAQSHQLLFTLKHGDVVYHAVYSSDGSRLITACGDGIVRIWGAADGRLIRELRADTVKRRYYVVALSADGRVVAGLGLAAYGVAGAHVWNAETGASIAELRDDAPSTFPSLAFSSDERWLVMGAPYRRWSSPPTGEDCDLLTAPEPDRRFLAIACKEQPTRIWDTAHDQLVAELPRATYGGADGAFAYPVVSAEGDRAAVARGNLVEVYELPVARLLRTIKHGAPVGTVAFARSGRDIVSGAIDGSVIVTRDNGATTTLPSSSVSVDAVGFLPDGRVLVADARRRVRVYDPGGTALAELETQARVGVLRMSPDGRRLVTVSDFRGKTPPELWDMERYQAVARLSAAGQGQAYSARFIGSDVMTANGDGAARLWGGEAGELRRTYRGGSRFLVDATLSADGTMLIGGGGDGRLRFWEFSSGRPLWTMQAHRSHLIGVHVEGESIVTRGFAGEIARWSLPKPEQVIEACDRNRRCAIVAP